MPERSFYKHETGYDSIGYVNKVNKRNTIIYAIFSGELPDNNFQSALSIEKAPLNETFWYNMNGDIYNDRTLIISNWLSKLLPHVIVDESKIRLMDNELTPFGLEYLVIRDNEGKIIFSTFLGDLKDYFNNDTWERTGQTTMMYRTQINRNSKIFEDIALPMYIENEWIGVIHIGWSSH